MKNKFAFHFHAVIALTVVFTLLSGMACFASDNPDAEDYNRMSDADFFGAWDAEQQVWTNPGALNYEYSEDLGLTEEFVKAGDYSGARQALLYYYRNRSLAPDFRQGRLDAKNAVLSMNDILHFECTPIEFFSVKNGADWYKFDVTNTSDAFLLASFEKSDAVTSVSSRESEQKPYLIVEQGGVKTTLYPQKDTYLDCGKPDVSFGGEPYMLVSDNGAGYNEATKQIYLRFDFNQIDRAQPVDKATLYLYMETEADEHELMLFTSAEKTWTESDCWNDISVRVASWKDIPGGFDWQRSNTSVGQYVDVTMRLLPMEPLVSSYIYNKDEEYAKHGIRLMLDFIKDNGGLYYDTNPSVRTAGLEAGFRGGNALNTFFVFLDSPYMTPEAAASMLKYFEREAEGFSMEKFFDSFYNGGGYQMASFMNLITYFPEFRLNEGWKSTATIRLDRLSKDLVRNDGTYLEATSGYADGVLGTFTTAIELARKADIPLSDEFMERYEKFARYIMGTATPLGKEPDWGDGGAASVRNRIYGCGEILDDEEMLYFGSAGGEGKTPSYTSVYFPDGKIAAMRTGWNEDDAYAFIIGRVGSSHSHTHTMALEAYAYGRYLLTDTGMTSYVTTHPHFTWQRTRAAAHNTVEINETSPQAPFNETGASLSQADMKLNETFDFFSGVTEGTEGYKHYRNVLFLKNRKMWLVSDYIYDINGTVPVNHYTQNWHMISDAKPSVDTETLAGRSNYSTGANIQVVPVKDENMSVRLADGIAMQPGANARDTAEAQYIEIAKDVAGDGSFDTVLYPTKSNYGAANISTERIAMPVAPEKASAYRIKASDNSFAGTYFISNEPVPVKRTFGAYTAQAKNIYIETNSSGKESYLCGTGIQSVESASGILLSGSVKLENLSASIGGGRAELYTGESFDPAADFLKLRAPGVEKVYLNGKETSFGRQGDLVVVGKCDEEMDEPDNPETPGGSTSGPSVPSKGNGGTQHVSKPASDINGGEIVQPETPAEPSVPVFADVQNHWAKAAVEKMLRLGVVTGNTNGLFEPDGAVTRAQLAVMAAKLLKLELKPYSGSFDDVLEGVWFTPYIEALSDAGVVSGDGKLFRPNDVVSRQEAAKILVGAYEMLKPNAVGTEEVSFSDSASFDSWAVPYIQKAAACGLINGFPDGTFRPGETMSRAQAVTVFSNFTD